MSPTVVKIVGALVIGVLALTGAAVEVSVGFDAKQGVVKPVNGVGQPPLLGWDDMSMFHYLKEAGIPYSRLHDVGGAFGKNLYVDIPNVFRDFDADETKPENYDFAFTDKLISALVENGVEPYYRLGVTIENAAGRGMPAYRIHPPKDYAKWARICEHVIRHYTEGWANGFHHKITRWEIWNEPENFETIEKNQMWKAPFSEYLKLYAVASRHLKAKFPHLQIGGYAGCGFYGVASWWAKPDDPRIRFLMQSFTDFLEFVRKEKLPLDFFSYHCYDAPQFAAKQFAFARQKLDEYGFTNTLASCNEWLTAPQTLAMTGTAKQAADIAAMLAVMQESPLDDAAIYDAKCGVSAYGPLFHPMTFKPHKAYWSFVAFNEVRKLGASVKSSASDAEVFATAARDESGRGAVLIANTSNRKVPLKLNLGGWQVVSCRLIDKDRTYERASLPDELTPESVCLMGTKRDDALLQNPISSGKQGHGAIMTRRSGLR